MVFLLVTEYLSKLDLMRDYMLYLMMVVYLLKLDLKGDVMVYPLTAIFLVETLSCGICIGASDDSFVCAFGSISALTHSYNKTSAKSISGSSSEIPVHPYSLVSKYLIVSIASVVIK